MATESTPPGELARRFVLFLAVVALSRTALNAVRPMMTYRALSLGAGPFEIGLITAVFSIAPALLAIRIGRSVDRRGEVGFLLLAMIAMTVGALAAAFAGSLVLLALGQIIVGIGHVTALIAGQTFVANVGTKDRREHRFGSYATMASVGQLAGPLLATTLVAGLHEGTATLGSEPNVQAPAFLAAAGATALSSVLVVLMARSQASLGHADRRSTSATSEGTSTSTLAVLKRPGMPFAMAVGMIVTSSSDALQAYLPLFGEAAGLSVTVVGYLLAVRAGASIVSRLLMGYLIDLLGRNLLLTGCLVVAAASLLAVPFTASALLLAALMALVGLTLGLCQPMTMAWVANRSKRAERATALGVRLTGNRAALVVAPVIVGAAAGAAGVSAIFWLLAAALGAGAVVAFATPFGEDAAGKEMVKPEDAPVTRPPEQGEA